MNSTELKIAIEDPAADVYTWQVPGKPVTVEIDLDVVDRLEGEMMRAFGSVPRRGVEIGGILLGTAAAGEPITVRIEDYEPVLSKHERGPSYILAGEDVDRFEEALERWRPAPGRKMCAIGYFRSHTRKELRLNPEDLELLSRYFPDDSAVALIVKPFATRAPVAGVFTREEGTIQNESSYQEFPFRRRELGGNGRQAHNHKEPALGNGIAALENVLKESGKQGPQGLDPPAGGDAEEIQEEQPPEPESKATRSVRLRGGWVWVPLSVMFLLVGTVLGFQVALSVRSQITPGPTQDPYALHLSATPSSDSVHVRWDRSAPAIRQAVRGVLLIAENGNQKAVDLDIGHLHNGSVIYRRVSGDVDFRLEVFTDEQVSVSETIRFRTEAAGGTGDAN
ncbi:MAG: hypothetical protein GY953_16275 [bacterium]|nr:hypothetical protein [bacterium]